MSAIPPRCPQCDSQTQWKEVVNPFTSGVPIGNGIFRFRLISIRGLFSHSIKQKLGFYRVKYHCRQCGYETTYELQG